MPIIQTQYKARGFYRSGTIQTITPSLFRKVPTEHFVREKLELDDGDFLHLDWSLAKAEKEPSSSERSKELVIISHGLEGNSRRPYAAGIARSANLNNMDAIAWNFRSCSGEMNRNLRIYHSGSTDDLQRVIEYAATFDYESIYLVGFSMGGNLTLLHVGREAQQLHPAVKAAVAFSVPCDLAASAHQLGLPHNKIYMKRFLRDLRNKVADKAEKFPDKVSLEGFEQITNFYEYDDRYTAPIHGFKSAEDYWQQSSSLFYLKDIQIPALLVNALDDSFLSDTSYPYEIAKQHPNLYLEVTPHGGHVGFIQKNAQGLYFSDKRALEFIRQVKEQTL